MPKASWSKRRLADVGQGVVVVVQSLADEEGVNVTGCRRVREEAA